VRLGSISRNARLPLGPRASVRSVSADRIAPLFFEKFS
jgi:hypothetical protein